MFLLSLVYLNFHGNSLKCPLRVTNCCISLGPRQVVPHMPVLIQVLFLCWSGTKHSCWETQNCCQLSRRLLFRCLSFKHVQDIQFSSITTFFLIFIPVFPSEKNIIRNVKTSLWSREKTVCISSDSKTSTDFSVSRFSFWPLHHVCYADGISSCTDPAAGPGWAETALILSMLSTTLPACQAAQTADYWILKVKDKTKNIFRDLKGWN